MRAADRASARRQLDRRLASFMDPNVLNPPPRGWVKAIREALGMTAAQLGRRLGVTQERALAIEKAEVGGAITLDSLQRAARALGCRLVYALVPEKPLDEMVKDRALVLASQRLKSTGHSMALEAQSVEATDEREHLERLTRQLLERGGSELWDEEK
ncbi:MAG TPA: mobile mystery protein A [Gammaproteobacteria bacterium]|nr:mobile mystery protein A [Gammaproteobacteria bacterium]